MKDLNKLKREFLEYSEIEKGQSVNTIENYNRYLNRFFVWLIKNKVEETTPQRGPLGSNDTDRKIQNKPTDDQRKITNRIHIYPSDISEENVRKYRLYINRLGGGEGLKVSTQNHHMLSIRSFLRYLSGRGIRSLLPERITLAKVGERKISFLDKDEYKRLIEAPDDLKNDGQKDKALLELLFSTGMRVSELCGLNLEDINFDRGEISVLGKGKKIRVVFISELALEYLVKYLLKRGMLKVEEGEGPETKKRVIIPDASKKQPVFISNRGNRTNPRAVERMVQKYSKIAGITKQVTPHTLRHTFATDLLQAGADIRSVQSLLGHSNITTTQIYTHVTDKHLREIHKKFHNKTAETKK